MAHGAGALARVERPCAHKRASDAIRPEKTIRSKRSTDSETVRSRTCQRETHNIRQLPQSCSLDTAHPRRPETGQLIDKGAKPERARIKRASWGSSDDRGTILYAEI